MFIKSSDIFWFLLTLCLFNKNQSVRINGTCFILLNITSSVLKRKHLSLFFFALNNAYVNKNIQYAYVKRT